MVNNEDSCLSALTLRQAQGKPWLASRDLEIGAQGARHRAQGTSLDYSRAEVAADARRRVAIVIFHE
jgi:hypothetical protein